MGICFSNCADTRELKTDCFIKCASHVVNNKINPGCQKKNIDSKNETALVELKKITIEKLEQDPLINMETVNKALPYLLTKNQQIDEFCLLSAAPLCIQACSV